MSALDFDVLAEAASHAIDDPDWIEVPPGARMKVRGVPGSVNGVDAGVPVDDGLNTVCGSNEEGFARLLRLYARPGDVVADTTYGNGRFWKDVDQSLYVTLLTDIKSGVDARRLPYGNETLDVEVFDPPYRYMPKTSKSQDQAPGHGLVDGLYNLRAANLETVGDVVQFYQEAFVEAHRVLKRGGFFVVKCQDTVQDGKNIWVHCILMAEAEKLGFACRDILVVRPAAVLKTRWKHQRHLRKAHSYFLVFRKGGHFPFGCPSMESR